MKTRKKVGRNDPCPCGTGKKYKLCCHGKVDWNEIFRAGGDWRSYLSIRGRNIYFMNRVAEVLNLDTGRVRSLSDYKAGFTTNAVREIHEAVLDAWPPDLDIASILAATTTDVSGLYFGDYNLDYISRGIVRHSIYANKILIVDPFVYPKSVTDEYNPLIEPAQYRTQTLKNVNFWLSLWPWIEAGIIEVIRTPADFDHRLNWESMERQRRKFDETPELREAIRVSTEQMAKRHMAKQAYQQLLLGAPDFHIEETIKNLGLEKDGFTAQDFVEYIHAERERDPDFLEPVGPDFESTQLYMMTTGTSYDIAQLTASITQSYLVTDLHVKWKEIELDRESNNAESRVWSPFAKALQESPLKFLNQLHLEHALRLRNEGRLEPLRRFLHRVWKHARTEEPFDETNARLLAEELKEEIAKAEEEWNQISRDLLKLVGGGLGAGLLAAGPLIASGHGSFLAAAGVTVGATTLASSIIRRKGFPDRFPAAFFMKIEESE